MQHPGKGAYRKDSILLTVTVFQSFSVKLR